MSLKDKMKTYNFWISLASAVVLILRIIGDKFNFFVDTSLIMDITTGLCSIFVILGILSVPKTTKTELTPFTNNSEEKVTEITEEPKDSLIQQTDTVDNPLDQTSSQIVIEEEHSTSFDQNNNKPSVNLSLQTNSVQSDDSESLPSSQEQTTVTVEEKVDFTTFESVADVIVSTINTDKSKEEINYIIASLKEDIQKANSIIEKLYNNSLQ